MTMKSATGPGQLVLVQTYDEAVANEAAEGKSVNSDPIPRMIRKANADGFRMTTSCNMKHWHCYVGIVEPLNAVGSR
jgi:hypothetical protein